MRDRAARAGLFAMISRLRGGQITFRERCGVHSFGDPGPDQMVANVEVHSPRTYAAFARGSLGLAEAYRDGYWDCDDLVAFARIGLRNMRVFDRARYHYRFAEGPVRTLGKLLHNPLAHKTKTARHYNTGNDFFEIFLDETMAYSCGVFTGDDTTLREASDEKFDRICRELHLGPADRVVEIGTGWGGFAIHAATHYGCHITSATISHEQLAYAQQRVRAAGVSDLVELVECDFAQLTGTYDKLVSVEMIESIGWRRFDEFFRVCNRLLKPSGAMLMQAITIDDDAYEAEKMSKSFINTLVFPGGSLPSNRFIDEAVERETDMRVLHREDMTEWYPITLRHWRERFNAHTAEIAALGYGEQFRRIWGLYLAYCEAGFLERRIAVGQTMMTKPAFGKAAADSADLHRSPVSAVRG